MKNEVGTSSLDTTRNQALQAWFQNLRCGGILTQNRKQNHLLLAIVFDCMVYPDPKLNIKNQ